MINRRTLLLGSLATATLAGCSGSDEKKATSGTSAASLDPNQKVTITVNGWDPGAPKENIDLVKSRVAQFQKKYPNITVEPKEWVWKADTFGPQLAGGQLPDVFWVPFTEAQSLINRGQLSDLTPQLKAEPWFSKANPNLWQVAQKDDKTYGMPFSGYGMALHINRKIFKAAGLDPDKNFATWDEFRAAAKAIKDKAGKQGFGIMATKNQGGWQLTTMAYAMGGRAEKPEGDKQVATLTDDAYKRAAGLLKDMRWTDDSIGANGLHDNSTLEADFKAGKVGMMLHVAGIFQPGMMAGGTDDDYGLLALPMEGADPGLLSGGNIACMPTKVDDAKKAAGVKWAYFNQYGIFLNEEEAKMAAETSAKNKFPVGLPQMPIFDEATLKQHDEWIKKFVNVPSKNLQPYVDGSAKSKLAAEPPAMAQDLYSALDEVVQAVQTDKNANVDALLQEAQDTITSKLG